MNELILDDYSAEEIGDAIKNLDDETIAKILKHIAGEEDSVIAGNTLTSIMVENEIDEDTQDIVEERHYKGTTKCERLW